MLDFEVEISARESRLLEQDRHAYRSSPAAYFRFLTDNSRTLFRRPASLAAPEHFDRPFELPDVGGG